MQRQLPSFDVVVIDEDQGLLPRLFECVAAQSAHPGRRILVRRKGAAPDPLISRYGWETVECDGVCTVLIEDGLIVCNEVFFDRTPLLAR